ncbi:hypothetical protein [Nocardia sp. NPDC052566]|uniref:hypothetical protein n=1 Tax=Nocardia sp. NPDC052566 TaxID=3364330 RepID=UPI0037CA4F70
MLSLTAAPLFLAPASKAAPPGTVTCVSVPTETRLDVTCTNTDVGAGTAAMVGLCSNARVLFEPAVRLAGNSTEKFSGECGPDAHPISWTVNGETDYQRAIRIDRERRTGVR